MFDVINNSKDEIEELKLLEEYVGNIVKKLNIEKAIFNIIFVDTEEIHALNRDYRGVDHKTDVITFALDDDKKLINAL